MGRFKDEHGHTRWQEGKKDVKEFIHNHKDQIGPIVEAVLEAAFPRLADVIEAISEVKNCEVPASKKMITLRILKRLKNDLTDEK